MFYLIHMMVLVKGDYNMKKFFLFILSFFLLCSCQKQEQPVDGTVYAKVYSHYKTLEPYLCLTFDDGPDKVQTPKVLELLKKYNVKATFFVLGEEVEYQKKMLKTVYDAGHEIGNHFFTHVNIHKLTQKEIKDAIIKNNELIEEVIGVKPTLVRPPYGIVTDNLKKVCKELDMDIILWNKDSKDWDKTPDSTIIKQMLNKPSNGDIMLFHDGSKTYTNTLSSLDVIIPTLQKKNFEFVSVSKLLSH